MRLAGYALAGALATLAGAAMAADTDEKVKDLRASLEDYLKKLNVR